MNESFFVKRERGPHDALAGRRFAGPNRWPADLPGFRETLLEYCEAVDRLAVSILPALSLSLGLPKETGSHPISRAASSPSGCRTTRPRRASPAATASRRIPT